MKIVIFTHPAFNTSESMPRYAKMLGEGMISKGHEVEYWTAKEFFYKIISTYSAKKWLGYIDQYFIFPLQVKERLKSYAPQTLFVFADQALGIWVPLVAKRHHVIHCHDFLALKSAIGLLDENPVSWTGQIYQSLIKKGFMQGQNFISVSKKTEQDLLKFLPTKPASSRVVYNQVPSFFKRKNKFSARSRLANYIAGKKGLQPNLNTGFILHVGIDVWYKNKTGVLELYTEWRKITQKNLPLVMVGKPTKKLMSLIENSSFYRNLIILDNIPQEILVDAYCGASVLIFPSLEEGFGWPIAEAMACGCPVITTKIAPMTEVGGNAAYYIDRLIGKENDLNSWGQKGARVMEEVLNLHPYDLEKVIQAGMEQVQKFKDTAIIDQTEAFYKMTLEKQTDLKSICAV